MKRIYDCICKKCFHQWKTEKPAKCPKCGCSEIDKDYDIVDS